MNVQAQIDFTTGAPINVEKLTGQNRRLYDYLMAGRKIHCMHPAVDELRIGYLNSRISDLANKFKIPIKKRVLEVEHHEEKTTVKEYWIEESYIKQKAA